MPSTETLLWRGDAATGYLDLIDQTLLPGEIKRIACRDVQSVWEAIKSLRVRGAPAIGIAAGYGVVVATQAARGEATSDFAAAVTKAADDLGASRPTAVNLFWALGRQRKKTEELLAAGKSSAQIHDALLEEARYIHEDDRQRCRAIGKHGAALLGNAKTLLTHCNAGGLATAEYGTALAVFFTMQDQGRAPHVYVDETRPLLQGARLTAWELVQRGIEATLICDNMAAHVMRDRGVQAVVTGADRIAANGDTANKIGTYALATLAKAHDIPFYIAAPISTFDLSIETGGEIPIEERKTEEVSHVLGRAVAPEGVKVYNPAFDVTPAQLITAIITERGVIQPVTRETIALTIGQGAGG